MKTKCVGAMLVSVLAVPHMSVSFAEVVSPAPSALSSQISLQDSARNSKIHGSNCLKSFYAALGLGCFWGRQTLEAVSNGSLFGTPNINFGQGKSQSRFEVALSLGYQFSLFSNLETGAELFVTPTSGSRSGSSEAATFQEDWQFLAADGGQGQGPVISSMSPQQRSLALGGTGITLSQAAPTFSKAVSNGGILLTRINTTIASNAISSGENVSNGTSLQIFQGNSTLRNRGQMGLLFRAAWMFMPGVSLGILFGPSVKRVEWRTSVKDAIGATVNTTHKNESLLGFLVGGGLELHPKNLGNTKLRLDYTYGMYENALPQKIGSLYAVKTTQVNDSRFLVSIAVPFCQKTECTR